MTWTYAYSPYILSPLLMALVLLFLAAYSWSRRGVPGALQFAITCLITTMIAAAAIMEHSVIEAEAKAFWYVFDAIWHYPAFVAVTCFILEYTWPGRWLTRRNLVLLSIVPLMYAGLLLTNNFHHLIYPGQTLIDHLPSPRQGIVGSALLIYQISIYMINLAVFLLLLIRSPLHRRPVAVMAAGHIWLLVFSFLQINNAVPSYPLLSAPPMGVMLVFYAIALFGFHVFDPIPLAQQMTIEQMSAGVIVLNPQGSVISMNPSAEQIFLGKKADTRPRVRGRQFSSILPAYQNAILDAGTKVIEFSLGAGEETKAFTLTISTMRDWRGLDVGRLLLLRDVTDARRAREMEKQQQQLEAAVRERERMARELHDSLGQVLGYIGMELEGVSDCLQEDRAAIEREQTQQTTDALNQAQAQVARLNSIVAEAHADLREYILNLRSGPSNSHPFFSTVQHYLDGYAINYAIQAELVIEPGIDEGCFGPDAQMNVFRMIQEALSNARKHSGASRVRVSFSRLDQRARVLIEDNGRGFDPTLVAGDSHFGLRFMRERAEQIGGSVDVQSAPGEGTQILIEVPCQPAGQEGSV